MKKKIKNVSKTSQRRKKKRSKRIPVSDVHLRLDLGAVEKLYAAGLIDADVGFALGLSERTINRYKGNDRFKAVIKDGRNEANKKVIRSLYQKCLGYNYAEVTMEPVLATVQQAGVKKKVALSEQLRVTKSVIKHVPADQSSIEFFLTNRDPDEWKKKIDVKGLEKIEPPVFIFPTASGVIQVPKS